MNKNIPKCLMIKDFRYNKIKLSKVRFDFFIPAHTTRTPAEMLEFCFLGHRLLKLQQRWMILPVSQPPYQ